MHEADQDEPKPPSEAIRADHADALSVGDAWAGHEHAMTPVMG
jgi:hypothetical protein